MELIDRNELKKALCEKCEEIAGMCQRGSCGSTRMIDSMPTVDAAPVVHGHWVYDRCSQCGFQISQKTRNFCPNCGAKMIRL